MSNFYDAPAGENILKTVAIMYAMACVDNETVKTVFNGVLVTVSAKDAARNIVKKYHEDAAAGKRCLVIDRSVRFSPWRFDKQFRETMGWELDKKTEDKRSTRLTEIDDLRKIQIEHGIYNHEKLVVCPVRVERLQSAGYICLDLGIFLAFWKKKYLIPESWKEKTVDGQKRVVYFEGSRILSPEGTRYVMGMYWNGTDWVARCEQFVGGRSRNELSAIIDR